MRSENYFSDDDDPLRWLEGLDRKRTWEEGPGNTAVIVADMQIFFTDPGSHAYVAASGMVLDRMKYLLSAFDGPVFFTRHTNDAKGDNLMVKWWRDSLSGSMAEIHPDLDTSGSEIIDKEHYSAFHDTNLEDRLRDLGVETVVIAGVLTDLCCETTARDAFMRGFKVIFLADCTATETLERHLCTLRVISKAFGEVMTSKEFLSR